MTGFAQTESLLRTFLSAVDAFNDQKADVYGGFLDNNVAVYPIHDPTEHTYRPKSYALEYMTAYMNKKAKFTPISYDVDGLSGIVKGIAQWTKAEKEPPITINYTFIFVFDTQQNKWLIVNLLGRR
jgi:hypothetical protein